MPERDIFVEAADWATQNRPVLVEIAERFLDDDWPTVDQLGRDALRRNDERDVFTVVRSIPPVLGFVDNDDVVRLRVRGMAVCSRAENILQQFVRVLWLAATRLESNDPAPKVSSDDLTGSLDMTDAQAQ